MCVGVLLGVREVERLPACVIHASPSAAHQQQLSPEVVFVCGCELRAHRVDTRLGGQTVRGPDISVLLLHVVFLVAYFLLLSSFHHIAVLINYNLLDIYTIIFQ